MKKLLDDHPILFGFVLLSFYILLEVVDAPIGKDPKCLPTSTVAECNHWINIKGNSK